MTESTPTVYTPNIWHGTHSRIIQIGSGKSGSIFSNIHRGFHVIFGVHGGHIPSWPRELTCHQRIVHLGLRSRGLAGALWVILESNGYSSFVYGFIGLIEVYLGFMGGWWIVWGGNNGVRTVHRINCYEKGWKVMLCFQGLIGYKKVTAKSYSPMFVDWLQSSFWFAEFPHWRPIVMGKWSSKPWVFSISGSKW